MLHRPATPHCPTSSLSHSPLRLPTPPNHSRPHAPSRSAPVPYGARGSRRRRRFRGFDECRSTTAYTRACNCCARSPTRSLTRARARAVGGCRWWARVRARLRTQASPGCGPATLRIFQRATSPLAADSRVGCRPEPARGRRCVDRRRHVCNSDVSERQVRATLVISKL